MPVYDYRCEKCGKVQEKFHKLDAELVDGCDNPDCDGEAKDLRKQLSPTPKHGSWSRWSV